MYKNLNDIKKQIERLKDIFPDNADIYSIVNNITTKDLSVEEIMQNLSLIKQHQEMSPYIETYFQNIVKSLEEFLKLDKQIKEKTEELKELIKDIKNELVKRNIDISDLEQIETTEKNDSIQAKKEYLSYLQKQIEGLKETKISLGKEKEVGSSFEQGFTEGEIALDGIKKINERAEENIKEIINPDVQTVKNFLNYYNDNRTSDANISIKIEKPENNNNRTLTITYFGTEVSEKEPKVIFHFSDAEYFDRVVLPAVLENYANENVTKETLHEQNKMTNVSESDDTLEMINMNGETVEKSENYLSEAQKIHTNPLQKNPVRVREALWKSPYGTSNVMILCFMILCFICMTIITIISVKG